QPGDLKTDAASVRGYALSAANGARSGPAYVLPLRKWKRSVDDSQVHSASGAAPAHTVTRFSEPARTRTRPGQRLLICRRHYTARRRLRQTRRVGSVSA